MSYFKTFIYGVFEKLRAINPDQTLDTNGCFFKLLVWSLQWLYRGHWPDRDWNSKAQLDFLINASNGVVHCHRLGFGMIVFMCLFSISARKRPPPLSPRIPPGVCFHDGICHRASARFNRCLMGLERGVRRPMDQRQPGKNLPGPQKERIYVVSQHFSICS